jgi:hypothetical protein
MKKTRCLDHGFLRRRACTFLSAYMLIWPATLFAQQYHSINRQSAGKCLERSRSTLQKRGLDSIVEDRLLAEASQGSQDIKSYLLTVQNPRPTILGFQLGKR